jgi:hypothetical protein
MATNMAPSITLTFNTSTHQTFAICTNTNEQDIDRLIRRLKLSESFASNPLLVPVILASFKAHRLRAENAEIYKTFLGIERAMGFWSPKHHGGDLSQLPDLAQMPQRLNKLSIRISEADLRCSSMDPVVDCLTNQLKDLAGGSCPGTKIELQEQVEFIRQRVWGVRVLTQRRREGVQSMVQTVRSGKR